MEPQSGTALVQKQYPAWACWLYLAIFSVLLYTTAILVALNPVSYLRNSVYVLVTAVYGCTSSKFVKGYERWHIVSGGGAWLLAFTGYLIGLGKHLAEKYS